MTNIKVKHILKLKNLKLELTKEKKFSQFLIQEFIDTVEVTKQDRIGVMYNESCIVIKKLNKRIVLLTRFLQEGY